MRGLNFDRGREEEGRNMPEIDYEICEGSLLTVFLLTPLLQDSSDDDSRTGLGLVHNAAINNYYKHHVNTWFLYQDAMAPARVIFLF